MRLWYDLDNLPDVNVFLPIMHRMAGHESIVTTRRFSGLEPLCRQRGVPFASSVTRSGASRTRWPTASRAGSVSRSTVKMR